MVIKRIIYSSAILLAITASSTLSFDADAASTQWEDLGGGKARLVASLDPKTNEISGVIEVKLEPGWSTYWRYPGSSGIPPLFNFSNSKGFKLDNVKFPVPKIQESYDIKYAGYKKQVSFPFEGNLLGNSQGDINLDLLIGVCSEICVPAKAAFNIPARDLLRSDPLATQVITLASLTLPKKAPEGAIVSVENDNNKALMITVKHNKEFGKPDLFVEGPSNWYLKPAKLMRQDDDSALFSLDLSLAPKDINPLESKLRYTLVTGSTGVEIER